MPYRAEHEAPRSDQGSSEDLVCEQCNAPVPRSGDQRCPQCLRRTSVRARGALARRGGDAEAVDPRHRSVWPYGRTCPLCATSAIDDSTVVFRISKVAPGIERVTNRLLVRVSVCAPCREHVRRLESLRIAAAYPIVVGAVVSTWALAAHPIGAIAIGAYGLALVAGAITAVVRRNRSLRRVLDEAGITDELACAIPTPSGLFAYEFRALHARTPRGAAVADLADVLRTERRLE